MATSYIYDAITQLSVGNVLQNILFYGLLVFITWVISLQLSYKKALSYKRYTAK